MLFDQFADLPERASSTMDSTRASQKLVSDMSQLYSGAERASTSSACLLDSIVRCLVRTCSNIGRLFAQKAGKWEAHCIEANRLYHH